MLGIIKKLDDGIEKVSSYGLIVSVALMLGLTVLTIVLRWFNVTLLWVDPLVRHLVFLTAFLGGVIATGRKTHIAIDIVSKIFEAKQWTQGERILKRVIALVCFFTLLWLIQTSIDFLVIELKYGRPVFFGISSGYLVGIIPVGFGLIAIRFLNQFFLSFDPSMEATPEEG